MSLVENVSQGNTSSVMHEDEKQEGGWIKKACVQFKKPKATLTYFKSVDVELCLFLNDDAYQDKLWTDMHSQVHRPHATHTWMYWKKKAFLCTWHQSMCTYFWNSSGSECPVCFAAPGTHLYHRKSTAEQPLAVYCHGCCTDPQGDRCLCPSSLKHTHRQTQPRLLAVRSVERRGAVALRLGPNLDENTKRWWKLQQGTGRTLQRSSSALTWRQEETTATKHLLPLLSGPGGGQWGGTRPLSIVRHNTGIFIHRHLCR